MALCNCKPLEISSLISNVAFENLLFPVAPATAIKEFINGKPAA